MILGCLVTGFIFLSIGARGLRIEYGYEAGGVSVDADIVDSRMDSRSGIYSLNYRFEEDGRYYSGSINLDSREEWSKTIQKKKISIRYWKNNPAMNRSARIDGARKMIHFAFVTAAGVFFLLASLGIGLRRRIEQTIRRLSRADEADRATPEEELAAFREKIRDYSVRQLEDALFLIKKDKFPEKHRMVVELLEKKRNRPPS